MRFSVFDRLFKDQEAVKVVLLRVDFFKMAVVAMETNKILKN
jgi:hypothetical protein